MRNGGFHARDELIVTLRFSGVARNMLYRLASSGDCVTHERSRQGGHMKMIVAFLVVVVVIMVLTRKSPESK